MRCGPAPKDTSRRSRAAPAPTCRAPSSERMRSRSPRASSFSRTRIGICRLRQVELREALLDVAGGRDARDGAERVGRDTELGGAIRQRTDHDLRLQQARARKCTLLKARQRAQVALHRCGRGRACSGSSPASVICSFCRRCRRRTTMRTPGMSRSAVAAITGIPPGPRALVARRQFDGERSRAHVAAATAGRAVPTARAPIDAVHAHDVGKPRDACASFPRPGASPRASHPAAARPAAPRSR